MSKVIVKSWFYFALLILCCKFSTHLSAEEKVYYYYHDSSKVRLNQSINNYQPVIMPFLTFDGKYLYFDRKFHPLNTASTKDIDDIWCSRKINDFSWGIPENVKELNTAYSDVLFNITPDENHALVYGIYNSNTSKGQGFSLSEKLNGKWTLPQELPIVNYYNDSTRYFGFISPERKILIMSLSRKDSKGGMDLYISQFIKETNVWSEPVNLKDLNSNSNEVCPVLAFDGKTIYFSSDRNNGSYDIYYSHAEDEALIHWSAPQPIGDTINSVKFNESSFCISADAKKIYYVSSDTASKRQGIYISDISERFKPNPYLILRGKILKEDLNGPVNIRIVSKNPSEINFIKTYSDSLDYSCVLKANNSYTVSIDDENGYSPYETTINTSNLTKISTQELNIQLKKSSNDNISQPKTEILKSANKKILLYFDFDSAELSDNILESLSNDVASRDKIKKINIYAYTDTLGAENYNINLSRKRAEGIKQYLIKNGFSAKNINTNAKGESCEFSDIEKNRYAIVEIIYK